MKRHSFISVILCALAFATSVPAAVTLQPGFDQYFIKDVGGRTRAWGIGVADFNGDLIPDIVSGDTYGDVHLFIGNGSGTFMEVGAER